ncbi:MAG: zf-HC2 domain-containing protein [Micavibrio sp.]|nr:zf-HC2 domain-containing protein [Micavibrio sp.]
MATLDHPTLAELLLWQSGELSPERAAEVHRHIAQCEECQAKIAELESLYGDLDAVSDQNAHFQFRQALLEKRRPFWRRFQIAPRWAAATASVAIVALLLVSFAEYTPSARAEVLLSRAVKAEMKEPEHTHLLKIHSSGMNCNVVVRDAAAVVSTSDSDQSLCGRLTNNLHDAGWKWNDLVSAHRFKQWRDGLEEKQDTISKLQDATEVTTTASDGPLHRATLRLRSTDYRPMQARFVFTSKHGEEQPEFEVTESEEVPQDIAISKPSPLPATPHPAPSPASLPVVNPLDTTESDVRLVLHRLGADKNVLLLVNRKLNAVQVSGIVPANQAASIRSSLAGLPNVETHVGPEDDGQPLSGWQDFHGDAPPLAYEQINELYANDTQGRRMYVNSLDAMTLRLTGEARTRDALLTLMKRNQSPASATQLRAALTDIDDDMRADLTSLSSALQPLAGPVIPQASHLTYARATQLYTLVHELVSMNKSDNALGLDETLSGIRHLISGS